MKTRVWRTYGFWILLAEGAGVLSGWLTRGSMRIYKEGIVKPPLSPPGVVFPVVWTVLYALMGIGAARVSMAPASSVRSRGLRIFLLQLAFNFFWGVIFFNLRRYGLSFFWLAALWGLILRMIVLFRKTDGPAARLQIPYLLWTAFAGYLNLGVWLLN